MSTKLINCKIKGISPLLMHAFPLVPIEAFEKKTPEEQAEYSAYKDPLGNYYVPGVNIQRCLIAAAAYSKGKGRASLQKQAAACLMVNPEHVLLNQKTYEIDIRPVVIPATKGRVLRYRPRFDNWELTFEIEYDDNMLTEIEIRRIVDDAGLKVGLLDFRPACKGPYGRFIVIEWLS